MPRPFAAGNTAFEGTAIESLTDQLPGLIQTDIPELDLRAGTMEQTPKSDPAPEEVPGEPSGDAASSGGCSASATRTASFGWIALSIVAMWLSRRRAAQ